MANRLRGVFGEVISETQNTFILGRLISDNIIVGFKCIHAIRNWRRDVGSMALKLDMSKANDQIESRDLVVVEVSSASENSCEDKDFHLESMAQLAPNLYQSCQTWCTNGDQANPPPKDRSNQGIIWCKPAVGVFKANTDASVCVAAKKIGIVIIVRDHEGEVLGSSTQKMEACFSPQVAEATAILHGIRFVIESGLLLVIVESDAKKVMDHSRLGNKTSADVGTIINDILTLIGGLPISIVF
ncbi:hypothetical protein Ddye_029672 [Dipteronia dyeriana]|uniref:RNase H type-1 domain-containing protein n=1 Tax=Dipteronia dyeriana TaxID=168575 RepID=A0AAD9TEV8_9ROSI|nr:hypothetical protein Ddye_029672 [Dipteronia dyeriana]